VVNKLLSRRSSNVQHQEGYKMNRRLISFFVGLVFVLASLSLGADQGRAQGVEAKKPILTKSGKKAALTQAAQAIIQVKTPDTKREKTGRFRKNIGRSISATATLPPDPTKIPHYFGPFPNYANSQFTLPDVAVEIIGNGTGAMAAATVGANGAVTGITITNPGGGYTTAAVNITGGGSGASADAIVSTSGVVTTINVDAGGAGYTAPVVAITGGGATTDAMATVYGGVDAVTLTDPGIGPYQFPTVDFDLPDGPDGVKAMAHAVLDASGNITGIVVDQPGFGYSVAPNVVIRDGTIFAPINNGGSGAMATATLTVQTVVVNSFGAGYTSAPTADITDSVGTGTGALATAFTDIGAVTAINLTAQGSGYVTAGGIKKFQDGLPMLCDPKAGWAACIDNNLGQHIPIAVPDTTTFAAVPTQPDADYYVIALVQHRERMSSSLPAMGTLQREYVQLETPANASWKLNAISATAPSGANSRM